MQWYIYWLTFMLGPGIINFILFKTFRPEEIEEIFYIPLSSHIILLVSLSQLPYDIIKTGCIRHIWEETEGYIGYGKYRFKKCIKCKKEIRK